ncbi:Deoxyguanosinetriphosphate triphosphohydrolase-like protein [Ephemeroptericola cinctiostellae]|uniref:Deoxyguanosinetriphosphate triphosphohydrolase-like protein n=1 Tax=Ephemeroptericola cinctiostellae TaxID=2268024 RepID=A0A345DDY1_9BURK|nr:deoxyguanosinetriphosphate triphosphohydrolase [Ephemeroptericola cinctiostellae]AXF86569.1 Deoxyguanosinetriphosphate triphosphohydrolase-like protein [Ephemeroptericola cinctiostellae]
MTWLQQEQHLAPYAAQGKTSRGRRHEETSDPARSPYARDRDRIVHATAFRRLEYKTQVFVNHEGDLFRTRLTHSMEVAQISRAVARNLRLNEDLIEAIALSHDLGHTPFGHAGQDALHACMADFGGFEHNLQSLRIVDVLEERYGAFDGLNLTFETREGILKHCARNKAELLGDVGQRFLEGTQPSLEAQLTNIADAIAYSNHDIDDGLRSGILSIDGMRQMGLFAVHHDDVRQRFPDLRGRREVLETVRRMINAMVVDLTTTTAAQMAAHGVQTIDDVRAAPRLAQFSAEMHLEMQQLKKYLMDHLYRHYQVMRSGTKAKRIVTNLFDAFMDEPRLLPPDYVVDDRGPLQAVRIADYIAGMTDRYAMKEHVRLFAAHEV